jgi:lysophospholipase L1-like esterase
MSEAPIPTLLFLGDCTPDLAGLAYPEQLCRFGRFNSINCGHTMATIREGCEYLRTHLRPDIDLVCLQYGLVDAWRTFRWSPYVLYYPDRRARKFARRLVKKYKKLCARLGLNRLLGTRNVVPLQEYVARIEAIVAAVSPRPVVLIETVPNRDASRNPDIRRYNAQLHKIAATRANVHVLPLFDEFTHYLADDGKGSQQIAMYSDPTHLSRTGHRLVAERLFILVRHVL